MVLRRRLKEATPAAAGWAMLSEQRAIGSLALQKGDGKGRMGKEGWDASGCTRQDRTDRADRADKVDRANRRVATLMQQDWYERCSCLCAKSNICYISHLLNMLTSAMGQHSWIRAP